MCEAAAESIRDFICQFQIYVNGMGCAMVLPVPTLLLEVVET